MRFDLGKFPHFFHIVSKTHKNLFIFLQVRVDINQTQLRSITACLRFPDEYPKKPLLVELKSRTLVEKVLDTFEKTCEQYCKSDLLGKPQIIPLLKYLSKTLEENPLCICYGEVLTVKDLIARSNGELKLKQKKSIIALSAKGGAYYFKLDIFIPTNYPEERPTWEKHESNFPDALTRFLDGQTKEIIRRFVEPPARLVSNAPPFKAKPSLCTALTFLVQAVHDFHSEVCPVCNVKCLPADPKDVTNRDTDDLFVERAYCGHIYHSVCLKNYFREPPFLEKGKLCAAKSKHARPDIFGAMIGEKNTQASSGKKGMKEVSGCGLRLMHDRWAIDPKKAEQRWAHKKARDRELEEVIDFFQ